MSYYVCKQSLCIKCDAVSIVSSVKKLFIFKHQVLLLLRWKLYDEASFEISAFATEASMAFTVNLIFFAQKWYV